MRLKSFLIAIFVFLPSAAWGQGAAIPPEAVRNFLVPYVWGKLPPSELSLVDAARDMQGLGAQGIRVFIGSSFAYPGMTDPPRATLAERLQNQQYQGLLNSGMKKILFTAYDTASASKPYNDWIAVLFFSRGLLPHRPAFRLPGVTPAAFSRVLEGRHKEFRDFCFLLSQREIEFYVSGWEAEHDAQNAFTWDRYATWYQAGIDGCSAGRAEARQLGYPGRVSIGFQFVRVASYDWYRPSGLLRIATRLRGLDHLDYSSWASITWLDDESALAGSFTGGIRQIQQFAREHNLPARLIIGEAGNNYLIHPRSYRMERLVKIAMEEGAELFVFWNAYEQVGDLDEWGRDAAGYGALTLDRRLTVQGAAYYNWYSLGIFPRAESQESEERLQEYNLEVASGWQP